MGSAPQPPGCRGGAQIRTAPPLTASPQVATFPWAAETTIDPYGSKAKLQAGESERPVELLHHLKLDVGRVRISFSTGNDGFNMSTWRYAMAKETFSIPNISCGHCTRAIETELSDLEGVTRVSGTIEGKSVEVQWQAPATKEQILALLKKINYPAEV